MTKKKIKNEFSFLSVFFPNWRNLNHKHHLEGNNNSGEEVVPQVQFIKMFSCVSAIILLSTCSCFHNAWKGIPLLKRESFGSSTGMSRQYLFVHLLSLSRAVHIQVMSTKVACCNLATHLFKKILHTYS